MDYLCDMNLKNITISLAATLIVAACAPKSDMDKYIDGLMSRMTLEQKIGQLNLHSAPGFISAIRVTEEDENVKLLRAGQLGGLYGTGNTEYIRDIQQIALESGAGIPLIIGMDVIHGFQTVFPVPLALSAWTSSTASRPCSRCRWPFPRPGTWTWWSRRPGLPRRRRLRPASTGCSARWWTSAGTPAGAGSWKVAVRTRTWAARSRRPMSAAIRVRTASMTTTR